MPCRASERIYTNVKLADGCTTMTRLNQRFLEFVGGWGGSSGLWKIFVT